MGLEWLSDKTKILEPGIGRLCLRSDHSIVTEQKTDPLKLEVFF